MFFTPSLPAAVTRLFAKRMRERATVRLHEDILSFMRYQVPLGFVPEDFTLPCPMAQIKALATVTKDCAVAVDGIGQF